MLGRLCVLALLTGACGGGDGAAFDAPSLGGQPTGGPMAGANAMAGGAQGGGGAGETATGGAGAAAGSGAAGAAGHAGALSGGTGGTGAPMGGAGSSAGAGAGGQATAGGAGGSLAGAGGTPSDPLEPKPLEGCPGYVSVFVPQGTCVWFHGTFTVATAACSVNPTEGKCATASAVSDDTTNIVSTSAEITRFDLDETGCPKKCQ